MPNQTKYLQIENKFASHKQYFFLVFLSVERQKRLEQTKVYLVFLLCLKRNAPQTFKSGSCKNSFLRCVRYWYNLLRWMFFILCDSWKTLPFVKVYGYLTLKGSHCCFFWIQYFARSSYFIRCLHNNNMMLIQSSKVRLIKLLNFRNFCNSSGIFFTNENFHYKLETSLEAWFYDAILII